MTLEVFAWRCRNLNVVRFTITSLKLHSSERYLDWLGCFHEAAELGRWG